MTMPIFTDFEGFLIPEEYARAMRNGDMPPIREWQEIPTVWQRIHSILPLASAKDSYVLGVDLSKWQVSWNVQQTIDAGAQYGFVKATQNKFTDERFDQFASAAHAANFPIGCYHFGDPGGYPAIEQAKYFASVVKGVGDLSVVLDLEWTGGLSRLDLERWAYLFMMELENQLPDQLKEIYTRVLWWDTNVAPAVWAKRYGLWAARWASWLESPWSDGKYIPRDWIDWRNWQWSGDGNGLGAKFGVGSNSIDLNYFHGDWDAFVAHYYPEPEQPPCDCEKIEVRLDNLEQGLDNAMGKFGQYDEILKDIDSRITELENKLPDTKQDVLNVVVNPGMKAVVFKVIDYDKACEGAPPDYDGPVGKPIAEPPPPPRLRYEDGQVFQINAKAWASCKDSPNDHIIHGSGYDFGVIADGLPGAGDLVRLDKISIIDL